MEQVTGSVSQLVTLWVFRILLLIGADTMFENIPDMNLAVAFAFLAVFGWIACVQWSRFKLYKKKHQGEDGSDSDFAFVPYLLIPLIFSVLAVFGGLWVGDYAAVHGYFSGVEEIVGVVIVASVVVYVILDVALVSNVGDAAYFNSLEADIAKSAASVTSDQQAALELLRKLLK